MRFLWLPFSQHQYLQPAQQIAPYQRAQYPPAPQYVPQIQPAQGGDIQGPAPITYHQYGNRQSQSTRPVVTSHSSSNLHKDFNGCRHLNLALSFLAEYNHSPTSYQSDCCIEHDGWNTLGDRPENVSWRLRGMLRRDLCTQGPSNQHTMYTSAIYETFHHRREPFDFFHVSSRH